MGIYYNSAEISDIFGSKIDLAFAFFYLICTWEKRCIGQVASRLMVSDNEKLGLHAVGECKFGRRTGSAPALAELMLILVRDVQSRAFAKGLNPAQWSALRFLAEANPTARTVTGFAQAHRTTPGTATQTIAALVRKGYVARVPLRHDRRSARLDLTEAGRALLDDDPLEVLAATIRDLPAQQQLTLADILSSLAQKSALSRRRVGKG
jgi:DNA-binding MarR family transcriptional regulator